MKKLISVTCAVLAGCLTLLSAGCGNDGGDKEPTASSATAATQSETSKTEEPTGISVMQGASFKYVESDGKYYDCGDGIVLLKYIFDKENAVGCGRSNPLRVDIPSEIDGKKVVGLADHLMREVPNDYDVAVTVRDTVTMIDEHAFWSIDEDVSKSDTLGEWNGCYEYHGYVSSVTVDEANENYSSEDGALYNKDKTKLLYFRRSRGLNDSITFRVPDSVEYIADTYISYQMERCHRAKDVDIYIGKNVKYIDASVPQWEDWYVGFRYHVCKDSYADEWLKKNGLDGTDGESCVIYE